MAGSDGGAGDIAGSKEEEVSTVKSSEIMERTEKDTDIPVRQHIVTPTPLLADVFTLSSTILFTTYNCQCPWMLHRNTDKDGRDGKKCVHLMSELQKEKTW